MASSNNNLPPNSNPSNNPQGSSNFINNALDKAEEFKNETISIADALISISAQLQNSLKEVGDELKNNDKIGQRIVKTYERDILGSIVKIKKNTSEYTSLLEKVNKGQNISKELSKSEIENRTKQLAIEQQIEGLRRNVNDSNLNDVTKKEALKNIKDLEDELNTTIKLEIEQNNYLKEQVKIRNNNLGVIGKTAGALDGILKSIDKSGNLSKMFNIGEFQNTFASKNAETLNKLNEGKKEGDEGFRTQLSGGERYKNLLSSINVKAVLHKALLAAGPLLIAKSISLLKIYDEQLNNITRTFGENNAESREFLSSLSKFKNLNINPFKEASGVTLKGQLNALNSINKSLGGVAMMYNGDIREGGSWLLTNLKLSEEATAGILKQSIITGKNVKDISLEQAQMTTDVEREFGIRLSVRQVQEEANKLSGQLLINTLKLPGGLSKAVSVAKSLGVEFKSISDSAKSLLNFEDSISKELEAELLLGRDINLEKARQFALNGDNEGVLRELVNQAGSLEELQSLNVIQQEALAGALGMSVDSLSDMLYNQTALGKESQADLDRKAEEVLRNEAMLSVQERIAQSMENFQSILSSSLPIMLGLMTAGIILSAVMSGGLGIGWAIGGGIVAGGIASSVTAIASKPSKVNDGIAPSSQGPFTITDKFGATSITTNGDNLAVSPNLTYNKSPQQPQPQIIVDNSESKETNRLLRQILTKQGVVSLNSTKMGTAMVMNSYEIQ